MSLVNELTYEWMRSPKFKTIKFKLIFETDSLEASRLPPHTIFNNPQFKNKSKHQKYIINSSDN